MRANGSFPAAGPTPPDTLTAALNAAGTFSGQWIRIQSLENPVPDYSLQLGEVEVYSQVTMPADQVNQAMGAQVTASGPLWGGFPFPGNITDGNRSTITHPATPVTSFSFTIDLGSSKALEHMNIVNRGDGCCPERLSNYRVTVFSSDDGEFGPAEIRP
jgi:predicted secreted protein